MQGKQIKKWNNTPGHRQVDCARSRCVYEAKGDGEDGSHDIYAQVPCGQRALKAQKYKAWGNAPGTQSSNFCRAVGAKTVQVERHELARKTETQPAFYKSSAASSQAIGTSGNYRENGREFRYQI